MVNAVGAEWGDGFIRQIKRGCSERGQSRRVGLVIYLLLYMV